MQLGELTLREAAKQAAGNWRHSECFAWHRAQDLDDADQWAIVYTHNRDSGLLDQSNSAAIEEAMDTFLHRKNPDVMPEHHDHWACGWVAGFSIRVFRKGRITKAFKTYHALAERLAQYPALDEADYSARQYDATISNLPEAAWKLKSEYELPEGWESEVFDWLADNDYSAIEDTDDGGGYPNEEQLRAAFEGLGYGQAATV